MSTPSDYLPPGWTVEKIKTATAAEYDALTEEQYQRLMDGMTTEAMRLHEINFRPSTEAAPGPAAFVEAIIHENLDIWGFVMVRTVYDDDAQWREFRRRWDEATQDQMVAEKGVGIDEVRDRLRFLWVEDPMLHGATPDTVRRHIHSMKERNEIPRGLDWAMCLSVDSASLKSLVEAPPTLPLLDLESPPFVVGVDIDYDSEEDDAAYTGYFKVAIATLLNELFPHLATETLSPDELAATIEEEHSVWLCV
ncbi:hypothetical protein K440DRAFT_664258 [Wilcoxina mikolae CBS 423.85]|nr:hypothetical protein K440DRAFT_664258 [Wilcoxina mikolae CBS 423.85]